MCELRGGGLLGLKTLFSNFWSNTYINTCYVLVLLLTGTMYTMLNNQNIPYLVAIIDSTLVGSATVSFKDVAAKHYQPNSIEGELRPLLDLVS